MADYVDVAREDGTATPATVTRPYITDCYVWVKTQDKTLSQEERELALEAYTAGRIDEKKTKEEPSFERKLLTWAMAIGTAGFALAIYFVIILKVVRYGLQW